MTYYQILERLPEQVRQPIADLVEAMQRDMREQLAVRRQDFDELQAVVRDLAEAQKRTEQRVEELAEAQKRTEQRLERLEGVVHELAEAQKRTEQRLERLETTTQGLVDRVGQLYGRDLERYYRERAGAYLGRWLWPVAAVPVDTLRETLESRLSESQVEDVMQLDVFIQGRARRRPGTPEVWLAMEVSAVIDRGDVERARRRAALLREAGYRVVPAVAGGRLTEGAESLVEESPIIVVLDGYSRGWEDVLESEA